ncbi:MAG TPA: DNA-binding protein [Mogibacterium sp.]|nr:DNA-binding protein [Mogibacterium sp.]
MKKLYFTITGTNHYHGKDFFEKDMKVKLIKEPDNPFDKEAIKVEIKGLGVVGYVANSPYTLVGESYSAGRLYDKIGDKAKGTVLYNVNDGVLCYISQCDNRFSLKHGARRYRKKADW